MNRYKIWSMMMLVVMMMPFVVSCSSSDGGEAYEEPIDVYPAVGTWRCIKSTDISGGKTLEDQFVGEFITVYSNNLYTSTSQTFGSLGSYKVNGQKVVVDNGRTFIISSISFEENKMTLEGSGEGINFKYVFEKEV